MHPSIIDQPVQFFPLFFSPPIQLLLSNEVGYLLFYFTFPFTFTWFLQSSLEHVSKLNRVSGNPTIMLPPPPPLSLQNRYTGLKVTLAGAVVYHVTIATVTGATSSVASPLVADTLGVITAGLASYPLDTVGKRLVVQMGSKTPRYSGARDCIKKVVAEEGVAALWGGVGYSVLSATLGLLATLPMILMNEQSQ